MNKFDHFSEAAFSFLKDLKENNTQAWFKENQGLYDQELKEPTRALAGILSNTLRTLTGENQVPKIYRIYRDVRFSKDKRPYNTHVHLSFSRDLENANTPNWFFGWDTEGLTLGCGVFQYNNNALEPFRGLMSGEMGERMMALTSASRDTGLRVGKPALKRIPTGYPKDHPNANALRRKGLLVWNDLEGPLAATQPGFVTRCADEFSKLLDVYTILRDIELQMTRSAAIRQERTRESDASNGLETITQA